MIHFTPLAAAAGGLLIGLAASFLMLFAGRIAGVSGFVSRLLPPYDDSDWLLRLAFVTGLMTAPWLYEAASGNRIEMTETTGPAMLVVAGFLVGFGSVLGGGCTSGHGVCGIARFSRRSWAATGTFMLVALTTVLLSRHLFGATG